MLIFATAKNFEGSDGIHQRNGITSWSLLRPKPKITIVGDCYGLDSLPDGVELRHIPEVLYGDKNLPLVNDIFRRAEEVSDEEFSAYINPDIVIVGGMESAVEKAREKFGTFLLVGRRYDLRIEYPIDYETDWKEHLMERVMQESRLFNPYALDYHIFNKSMFSEMPPFMVARTTYDNWMLYDAVTRDIPVIDATNKITIIHSDHVYDHGGSKEKDNFNFDNEECRKNQALGDEFMRHRAFGCSYDATYEMSSEGDITARPKQQQLAEELKVIMSNPPSSNRTNGIRGIISRYGLHERNKW